MLESLNIKNIVLIESLEISFADCFCVLTGETGAGKSILLDSLSLAMGKRADANLVRHGQNQGSVIARFSIKNNQNVLDILAENALDIEDDILLKRVINIDGKSRAFINGEPVSINLLQQLSQYLLEIHGQHDQRGLMDVTKHRELVDIYCEDPKLLNHVKQTFHQWKYVESEYLDVQAACQKAQEDEEYLRHVLKELQDLSPENGEEEELASKRQLMINGEKIIGVLNEALGYLNGKHNVQSAISSAERVLHRTNIQADDVFEPAFEALDRAGIEVAEAVNAIESVARDIDIDSNMLDETEERLFSLRAVARKYKVTVDGLNQYTSEVEAQINLLESQEENLEELHKKMQICRDNYDQYAQKLTEKRVKYSEKLSKLVAKELAPLKMESAALQVVIDNLPENQWNEFGQDKIKFLVRTNSGSKFGDLGKVASGGELSRFMLAMKVVLSEVNQVPTMIFDEIDTGIGGATADAVGKRLHKLAENTQILCVTHQPQVASYGGYHLKISKATKNNATATSVIALDKTQRTEEIARMLAGRDITSEARAAANKLMGSG